MPRMFIVCCHSGGVASLADHEAAENQQIQASAKKYANGVTRGADDRLRESVERRVDQDARTGRGRERLVQFTKERRPGIHGLRTESRCRARQGISKLLDV